MLRPDRRAKLLNAFRARRRRNYKREYRHPAFSARIVSMRCTSLCRTDKPEAHRNRVLKTVQRLTSGISKLPGMDRAELPTIVQRTRLELVAARGRNRRHKAEAPIALQCDWSYPPGARPVWCR